MNLNKNYYGLLEVSNTSTEKQIKKAYYNMAKIFHPDKNNKEVDSKIFADLTEAYDILCSEQRKDYDMKSKFGNCYNEYYELFETNFDFSFDDTKDKLEKFKKNEVFNIHLVVDDTFDGKLEYERWVRCKTCDGSGKDLSSKIVIRDVDGNILRTFDSDDGCDFCEGTGKDYNDKECSFCSGHGKIGLTPCKVCKGEKRILGSQKLSGIKLTGDETKIDAMGHCSKDEVGKVGYLLLIKHKESQSSE
jgi:DnaJ-class molecular chaperone